MILATLGMCLATMVGPLDEAPVIRISRPGSAPEFVRQVAVGDRKSGGGIVVPDSAMGGGGAVTVIGAADAVSTDGYYMDGGLGLQTDQIFRAFGYDTGTFGYTTINYPGGVWGGHGGWGRRDCPRPVVDPRIISSLRDLVPIEAKFPPVPGR